MRHSTTRNHGDALRPVFDDFRDFTAEIGAVPHRGQRRQVNISEERDNRDLSIFEHVLERRRKRMAQQRILGIGDLKTGVNQFFEKVFRHFPIVRKIVTESGMFRDHALAGNDGKSGNTGHAEGFQMVAAEKQNDIRFRFIQQLSELSHGGNTRLALLGNFVRGAGQ